MRRKSLTAIALAAVMVLEIPGTAYAAQVSDGAETAVLQTSDADGTEIVTEETDGEKLSEGTSEKGTDPEAGQDGGGSTGETDGTGDDSELPADGTDETVSDEEADETSEDEITEETDAAELSEEDAIAEDVTDELSEEAAELLAGTGISELDEDDYKLTADQINEKAEAGTMLESLSSSAAGEDYVDGEVFFFADDRAEAKDVAEAYNSELTGYDNEVAVIELDEAVDVEQAVEIGACEDINLPAVYPNYYRQACVSDTDGSLGAFTDSSQESYQWYQDTIGSEYAWRAGYTGSGITIAVLDSGFASDYINVSETYSTLSLDSDTVTAANPSDPADDAYNHGTHVTGIIASHYDGKNSGVAPDATIIGYRVLDDNGGGTDVTIIQGLNQAIARGGVDLINMSIGGFGYTTAYDNPIAEAYKKGITIIASAGNSGNNRPSNPAAHDHVISVAATDTANQLAYFSNYGSTIDLAAPGLDIYSTYSKTASTSKTGGNEWGYDSGTSMAAPIVTGEAALILQAAEEGRISGIAESGPERVDDLEAYMKKSTISAASGAGSGIVYLPKALGLSVSTDKPAAPAVTGTVSDDLQSVDVNITAALNTTVYYTLNGKTPDYLGYGSETADGNTFRADDGNTVDFSVSADAEGLTSAKVTVTALAVNAVGTAGPVKKATYTLKPWVTDITVTAPTDRVEPGKSIQLKAAVLPSFAANKGITWKISESTDISEAYDAAKMKSTGVSISTSGKFSVAKKTTEAASEYYVFAAAKDAAGYVSEPVKISLYGIEETKVTAVSFGKKTVTKTLTADYPSIWMLLLAEGECGFSAKYSDGTQVKNMEITSDGEVSTDLDALCAKLWKDFKWTSSNPSVVAIGMYDEDGNFVTEDRGGWITALAPGTAVITAAANDSSGKKASVTVKVIQKVTEVSLSAPSSTLAAGSSMQIASTVLPAGAANKKLNWSVYTADSEGNALNPASSKEYGISVSSAGKLSASKNVRTDVQYVVTAVPKDDEYERIWGSTGPITIIAGGITGISMAQKTVSVFRTAGNSGSSTSASVVANISGKDGFDPELVSVSSSNPNLVKAEIENTGSSSVTIKATAAGKAAGKATVTVAATDGSGKKASFTVNVLNPPSAVSITVPQACNAGRVPVNKAVQFKANVLQGYGAVSTKNVKWSIVSVKEYNYDTYKYEEIGETDAYATITASGKLTINTKTSYDPYERKYTVCAEAKDGSGVKGIYEVIPTWDYGNSWFALQDYTRSMVIPASSSILFYRLTPAQIQDGNYRFYCYSTYAEGSVFATSSDESVAEVWNYYDSNYGNCIGIIPKKAGTFKIIVKAYDGYGRTMTYNCKVDKRYYN